MADFKPVEVEELELALARLEWARAAATCCDLPAQRAALEWHLSCWESALAACEHAPASQGDA